MTPLGLELAAPAVTVPEQLRFTATTLDGKDFSGESLTDKAAILWFWAPWCSKCQREAPAVAGAATANAGKIEFIGVAARDELAAVRDFVTDYQVGSFPHLADLDAAIWRLFDVTRQPAYAFIKPDGSVEVVKNQLSETERLTGSVSSPLPEQDGHRNRWTSTPSDSHWPLGSSPP